MTTRTLYLAAIVASLTGCALTTKSAPMVVRYFDLPAAPASTVEPAPMPAPAPVRLRLGRVTSSAHLRFRIVERTSAVELRAYDSLRWTDYPEVYVRRAVTRALFADGELAQVVGGAVPTLDLEVVGFEQGRSPAGPIGRVELRYQLRDDRAVLAAGRIAIERPATARGFDGVIAAIGAALDAAADELAARIIARLR